MDERKVFLKLFLLLDGFCEVALCVALKTTKKDGFRNSCATQTEDRASFGVLAFGFGVLGKRVFRILFWTKRISSCDNGAERISCSWKEPDVFY